MKTDTSHATTPHNHVLGALQGIANLHGNLPLLPLYESCGPHEGTSRGIKLATAIEMAREAIPLCEDQAAQLAAERAIKAELVAALEDCKNSIRHAAHCKAPLAFPCSCNAETLWDTAIAALARAKEVQP